MGMTTSKVAARKAARQAQAAAQAAETERLRLNVEDLATFYSEQGRAEAIDEWLAVQRAKLRATADRRHLAHRRAAGVALRAIRDRGESMKSIAALAGVSENLVRGLIKEAGLTDGGVGGRVNGDAAAGGLPDGSDGRVNGDAAAG